MIKFFNNHKKKQQITGNKIADLLLSENEITNQINDIKQLFEDINNNDPTFEIPFEFECDLFKREQNQTTLNTIIKHLNSYNHPLKRVAYKWDFENRNSELLNKINMIFKKYSITNDTRYYQAYPLDDKVKEILDYFRNKTQYNPGLDFLYYTNGHFDTSNLHDYFNIIAKKETWPNYDYRKPFSEKCSDFLNNLYSITPKYPEKLNGKTALLSFGDELLQKLVENSKILDGLDDKKKTQLSDFIEVYKALGITNQDGPVTDKQINLSKKIIDAYYEKYCKAPEQEAINEQKIEAYKNNIVQIARNYLELNKKNIPIDTTPEELYNKLLKNYPKEHKDFICQIIFEALSDHEYIKLREIEKEINTKFQEYLCNTNNIEKTLTYLKPFEFNNNFVYADHEIVKILSEIYSPNTTPLKNKPELLISCSIHSIHKELRQLSAWQNYINDIIKEKKPENSALSKNIFKTFTRRLKIYTGFQETDIKQYIPLIKELIKKQLPNNATE